jgi:DNA helicase HerA-like ATPase
MPCVRLPPEIKKPCALPRKLSGAIAVGEALVSFLDESGTPGIVERALICPPHSQIGPITPEQRRQLMQTSLVAGVYENAIDRESAFEILKARAGQPLPSAAGQGTTPAGPQSPPWYANLPGISGGGRRRDNLVEAMAKSAARTIGSSVGRQIVRGVLGSLLGGSKR